MTPELRRACEMIFQEHKTSAQPINWHKDLFRGRISIGLSEVAKETLLKNKIIQYVNHGKKTITILQPEMAAAVTFEEALIIAQNKMPALATITTEASYATVIDDLKESSFFERSENPPLRLVKVSGEVDIASTPSKWYTRPLFYYFIGPASALALGALIAFGLSEFITRAFR
jgi:hypothetical protein